jgi:DNA-binding CsgD family transcriptional regulator
MVPFRGQCLVRRSELLQLHGDWLQSLGEVQRACARIAEPAVRPEAGMAHYQLAELHRLRGEFTAAETSFRDASQAGRRPQPGLALLRLAQGHAEAAAAAIRQAMHETRAWPQRAHLLRAGVEILLAAGDPAAAQDAADELTRIAGERDAPFLRAAAAHAAGAVALAGGSSGAAVEPLREAWAIWRELEAPYEGARVRMLLGEAYARLGDLEAAQLELEAAQEAFERLGAAPDAECAARVLRPLAPRASGPLTGREVEVLRLVATGKTNRAIAADLSISEKTVARHISNIFNKLDLSSRAEATAYAYSHKVL